MLTWLELPGREVKVCLWLRALGILQISVLGKGLCQSDEVLTTHDWPDPLRSDIQNINVIPNPHEYLAAPFQKNGLLNTKLPSGVFKPHHDFFLIVDNEIVAPSGSHSKLQQTI